MVEVPAFGTKLVARGTHTDSTIYFIDFEEFLDIVIPDCT